VPIYEYLCQSCAHRFEVKQRFNDPPLDTCVRCGQAVTRIISPPAIMFKGSGWYVTDYSDKLKAPGEAGTGDGQAPAKPEAGQKQSTETTQSTEKTAPAGGSAPSASKDPGSKEPAKSSPASADSGSSKSSTSSSPSSSSGQSSS
jgi:putative FmdB family regulatory protein